MKAVLQAVNVLKDFLVCVWRSKFTLQFVFPTSRGDAAVAVGQVGGHVLLEDGVVFGGHVVFAQQLAGVHPVLVVGALVTVFTSRG